MASLDSTTVRRLFNECCVRQGESIGKPVDVQGIRRQCRLHPARLDHKRTDIRSALEGLPDAFKVSRGGSDTYENFGKTCRGFDWTDDERTKEQLLMLGLGAGLITLPQPRSAWQDGKPLVSVQI